MTEARSRRPTVLLVEDLDQLRSRMRRTLERHGYDVAEAADDREAIEAAERARPDLIVTEEELPTFRALTERVGRHPGLRGVPVVIVNPDAERGTRHGGAVVLAGFDELERLIPHPSNHHGGK